MQQPTERDYASKEWLRDEPDAFDIFTTEEKLVILAALIVACLLIDLWTRLRA